MRPADGGDEKELLGPNTNSASSVSTYSLEILTSTRQDPKTKHVDLYLLGPP
jgi:hypothetical protein